MADHQDQESDSCSFVFIRGKNIFSILLNMHAEIALNKSIHQQLVCGKGGVNRRLMTRTSADHC